MTARMCPGTKARIRGETLYYSVDNDGGSCQIVLFTAAADEEFSGWCAKQTINLVICSRSIFMKDPIITVSALCNFSI